MAACARSPFSPPPPSCLPGRACARSARAPRSSARGSPAAAAGSRQPHCGSACPIESPGQVSRRVCRCPRSGWASSPGRRWVASPRWWPRPRHRATSRCWLAPGCPPPASSFPTHCSSAGRDCAAAASSRPARCLRPARGRRRRRARSGCRLCRARPGRRRAAGRGAAHHRRRALLRATAAGGAGSLRARVPGSEIATLCAAIERSRRYGSPLAEQLRRQSSALRSDQRRAVEESAARAAPKIQLVVALVLVPSVLLMITAALIANADVLLSGL